MRGFGFRMDVKTGSFRGWYAREDGIQRWVDTDDLVEGDEGVGPEPEEDDEWPL